MNREIVERLAGRVPDRAIVRDICLYPHWVTASSVRDGLCCYIPVMNGVGMPATPRLPVSDPATGQNGGGGAVPAAPETGIRQAWQGRRVRDAVRACLSRKDILSRSVGLALLNSALPDPPHMFEGEAQYFYNEKVKQARVCCIGHFDQARQWREAGCDVTIIELKPKPGDILWSEAEPYLTQCDIVFITGITLINDTFDTVLALSPNARERVLFGPSVPFCDLWFDYGITAVGSTRILAPQRAADYFGSGGTSISRVDAGVLMKINLAKPDHQEAICGSTR